MKAAQLLAYMNGNVPGFINAKTLQKGKAFHYTMHSAAIQADGKFLGAAIDPDLDFTQRNLVSTPATHDPGVVFAYLDRQDADDEARTGNVPCEIYEIEFDSAVIADHAQEIGQGAPSTVLIPTTEITRFKIV